MSNMSVTAINEFMDKLTINTRNEKIKEFLRFQESDNYFEFDETEEIVQTKNTWAGYAYLVMIERLNNNVQGPVIDSREEKFLENYFDKYLLTTTPVGLENELKKFYIKHRLTKDFKYNKTLNEESVEQFKITLETLISQMYNEDIKINYSEASNMYPLDNSYKVLPPIIYNSKEKVITIRNLKTIFEVFINSDCQTQYVLDWVKAIVKQIELSALNDVKRHEISKRALIYTIEDYLESKAMKDTKLGKVYRDLYCNIISNKKIILDASKRAQEQLLKLKESLSTSEYDMFDKNLNDFVNDFTSYINDENHYFADAKYFDTNNLENDAFSKLYNMYIKGLKAMPKSKLTEVTKYFAINGNPLTFLDMGLTERSYKFKISKEKDEEKRKALQVKWNNIEEVLDLITDNIYSYKLEEEVVKIVSTGKNIPQELISEIKDNYSEYEDMKYRLECAYKNLENLASSGSHSKVYSIREKSEYLYKMLKVCDELDLQLEEFRNNYETIDTSKDVIISSVADMNKAITMLQELSGRGVLTTETMIQDSLDFGTPVMKNLSPGFKEFVEQALSIKGVSCLKKK